MASNGAAHDAMTVPGIPADDQPGSTMTATACLALSDRFAQRVGVALLIAGLAVGSALPSRAADVPSDIATREANLSLATEPAGADGVVRGALLIDLAAGWHTYWRDPGASGIPPTLDFSGTTGFGDAVLHFAAPHRFGSDLTRGNGYTEATAIAFELTPEPGATIGAVDARIFLGVCREICIPVQAEMRAQTPTAGNPRVEAAFAALPAKDGSVGQITAVTVAPDASSLTITATYVTAPSKPDLFVTGPKGWFFDEPSTTRVAGKSASFTVPIVQRPPAADKTSVPETIDIIASNGERAFETDGSVPTRTQGAPLAGSKRP